MAEEAKIKVERDMKERARVRYVNGRRGERKRRGE